MLFLKKNRQQERYAALWSTDSVKAAILIIYTHQTQKQTYLKTITPVLNDEQLSHRINS